MQKLVNCHVCGKKISNSAETCPNCGGETKNMIRFRTAGLLVFALILVVFGLLERGIIKI